MQLRSRLVGCSSFGCRVPATSEGSKGSAHAERRNSKQDRFASRTHSRGKAKRASRDASDKRSLNSLSEGTHTSQVRSGSAKRRTDRAARSRTPDQLGESGIIAATVMVREKLITGGSADDNSNQRSAGGRQEANRTRIPARIRGDARSDQPVCRFWRDVMARSTDADT